MIQRDDILFSGYFELHKNADKIILLVQMLGTSQADLPCFSNGGVEEAVKLLRERLHPGQMSKGECAGIAD